MNPWGWTYTPQLHDQTFTFKDILRMVRGNVYYAEKLRDRLTWQHPATLIDEDCREKEILKLDDSPQVYAVGQPVKILGVQLESGHKNTKERWVAGKNLRGKTGTIIHFSIDRENMIAVEVPNEPWMYFHPHELEPVENTLKGRLFDILYSDVPIDYKLDNIETELLNHTSL